MSWSAKSRSRRKPRPMNSSTNWTCPTCAAEPGQPCTWDEAVDANLSGRDWPFHIQRFLTAETDEIVLELVAYTKDRKATGLPMLHVNEPLGAALQALLADERKRVLRKVLTLAVDLFAKHLEL